jgi:hypothetical protein
MTRSSHTWSRVRAWFALRLASTRCTPDGAGIVVEHVAKGRVLSRVRHECGRANGPSESWWPSGAKRSHGSHKDGQRDGDWFEFHADGTLDRARTGLYRDGLRIAGIRGFNEWLGSP